MANKWVEAPEVVFDSDFDTEEYRDVVEYAISTLNKYLVDIQLTYRYGVDFKSLNTFIEDNFYPTTALAVEAYNADLIAWQTANPRTIRVELDRYHSGFSGGVNFTTGLGTVRIRKPMFDEQLTSTEADLVSMYGVKYKQKDILTHEIAHALGIEHQMGPIDTPEERRISDCGRATSPLMNPFVNAKRHGLTMTDISSIMKLYGRLPDYHKVTINFTNSNALNVALLPGTRNIMNWIRRDFTSCKKQRGMDRIIAKSCAHSVIENTVQLFVPEGKYIVEIRASGNTSGTSGFEGESGTPSIEELPAYLNKRYKVKPLNKANRILINSDIVIDVV